MYQEASEFKSYPVKEIVKVIDGDTVDVILSLGFDVQVKKRIRLSGVDTPESRTRDEMEKEYGLLAKSHVQRFCDRTNSTTVRCVDESDKYGRTLAELWVNTEEMDICVNKWLCENHHAVAYHGQNKDDIKAMHIKNRSLVEK